MTAARPVSPRMQQVRETVAAAMDDILREFKPGAKIAVLVRSPGHPDRDFVMTNDGIAELIAMLERRRDDLHGFRLPADDHLALAAGQDGGVGL
jgi:hypothetical protein